MSDLFGSKPFLPRWHGLDLTDEQGKAIAGNIANLPEASRLANLTEEQILSMLGTAIPGFEGMRTQISGNISDELAGKIPKDVQDAIQNSAAAKALGGGFGGSGMHGDLVARDLGLTSLNLMDKGLSSAESWMASTERMLSPAIAEFTNMFVSPGEQANFDVNERNMKFAHDWLGSQISAMPDPTTSGIVGLITGAGDSARGNSTGGFGAQQAQRANAVPQSSTQMDQWGNPTGSNAASGWETAPSWSSDLVGAEGAGVAPGVSAGFDWSAVDAAYAGALA